MDLNKVVIMGHVGQDPEFHTMDSGKELCKFTVATSRRWKDKNSGEKKEDTQWHNVVVFNEYLIGICHSWLQKGTRVYLEGEIKTRTYYKNDVKHWITEILIPQIKGELFVIEKGKGWDVNETPGAERGRGGDSGGPQPAGAIAKGATDDFDDDIPF
jgi:single-strand DNA-binding protein